MYTLLNWSTNLPPRVASALFYFFTILFLLLPWGVARWHDRHAALVRRHRAPLWKALLGAVGTFIIAFIVVGIMTFQLIWFWANSNNNHGQGDDMATGVLFGITIPLSCLISAFAYQAIRWVRGKAVADHAASAEHGSPAGGGLAVPSGNSDTSERPSSVP